MLGKQYIVEVLNIKELPSGAFQLRVNDGDVESELFAIEPKVVRNLKKSEYPKSYDIMDVKAYEVIKNKTGNTINVVKEFYILNTKIIGEDFRKKTDKSFAITLNIKSRSSENSCQRWPSDQKYF